jgi:3-hydroxyisobutyryl-CoA hydrolase
MTPLYEHWNGNGVTKGIILQGSSEKAFCAGGDIKDIYYSKNPEFFKKEYKLNQMIGNLKIPHIAIIDGIVMGGGVGLSVHGSHRIATETSTFAMPETAIGFFCDVGGSHFLSRLPKHLGIYLALTGARLKGKELLYAGVATHYVPREKLETLKSGILTKNEPLEEIIRGVHSEEGGIEKLNLPLDKIDTIFSKVTIEEIIAELEQGNDEWSKSTLKTLEKLSPTSLKVVLKQINNGKSMDLKQCLEMEYRIAEEMMSGSDFFEGVRAMLIDKDKSPKWNPSSLDQVTDEAVNAYFQ